jgi:hypothetical protein
MRISVFFVLVTSLLSTSVFAEAMCEKIAKDEEKLWG